MNKTINYNNLNEYEFQMLTTLKVNIDEVEYTGFELIDEIVRNNEKGNYRLYNMATGGAGPKYSPVANLLSKIGIE